jgi:SPP1 gp7 family putative phage head morphogenesis protein
MSRIATAADRFRREILSHGEAAGTRMVETYGNSFRLLSSELDSVVAEIIALEKQGKAISRNLIYRYTRIERLLTLVEDEVGRFSRFAEQQTALEQAFAVEKAQFHSQEMIRTAIGPMPEGYSIPANFTTFNPRTVETFIGRASNGSPLRTLFEKYAKDSVADVENVFVEGIVSGRNPREVARELTKRFEVPKDNALRTARTEMNNAWRESNRQGYIQNAHVVERWRWQAAFQKRTCACCLAMDGREFPTQVPLGTHPNCRCAIVPVTRSWRELGIDIPDRRSRSTVRGEEWFDRQPDDTKLAILGRRKFDRYKEGNLKLTDLVGYKKTEDWGETRFERSLKAVDKGRYRQKGDAWGIIPTRG